MKSYNGGKICLDVGTRIAAVSMENISCRQSLHDDVEMKTKISVDVRVKRENESNAKVALDELSPLMFRFLFSPPPNRPDTIASFPYNAANCLNSGDFDGLSKLVGTHMERGCDISVSYSPTKLNNNSFVRLFELLNEAHPDRIMSVQNLETFRNRIAANVYMKFTDCKPLYESVAKTIKDPTFADYFPPSRSEILKRRMRTALRPDAERQQLEALLESDSDIVVYGCVQLVLTVDETTSKAIGMQMLCDFNSAHVASHNCY